MDELPALEGEKPLVVPEVLAEVRPRPQKQLVHWALFVLTLFLLLPPLIGAFIFGSISIGDALSPSGHTPWWGGLFAALVIVVPSAAVAVAIFGFMEAKVKNLILSLAGSILAWPAIAFMIYFLFDVIPR